MAKLKEVTVFTDGDSEKISTWSNVPFFFTETLQKQGIKVNRVNICITKNKFLLWLYKPFFYMAKLINRGTNYHYIRSWVHYKNIRYRIKKAVKAYPNSDADIFMTFSFSSVGYTDKKIVQFCDWTFDHYFNYFDNREPDFFERKAVKREDSQIMGSDLVIPLFPSVTEYMKERYGKNRVFYIGNVINSLYEASTEDIENKLSSFKLLFIGNEKYIEGAKVLIAAFTKLKQMYPKLTLDIVGMEYDKFTSLPEGVVCHGYLDKGRKHHRELYYKLLRKARIFINTTPKWGAFSASIEAMYFCLPVIVTPYEEFVSTFGKEIGFGAYCEKNDPTLLTEKIHSILTHPEYKTMCIHAHNAVKEFTWDAYTTKFIHKINEIM